MTKWLSALCLAAAFAAGIAYFGRRDPRPDALPPGGGATATPSPAADHPDQESPPAAAAPAPRPPTDTRPAFVQPNGQRLPLLNGVTDTVLLRWPSDEPYSPIVGTRIEPTGTEWYVHADGSRSTMQMVWRSDLGKQVAASVLARPTDPVPMQTADEEEAAARRARGR